MKTFKELLKELRACNDAVAWTGDKSIEEVVATCERGDWLLWLAAKVETDKRLLTLAKAKVVKTVYHLMKDERSRKAVRVAEAYGNGKATDEELRAAAYAAAYAAAAYAYASAAAASAADAAASAADADAAYACAAYAAYADAAYNTAILKHLKRSSRIVRRVLGEELIRLVNLKLKTRK